MAQESLLDSTVSPNIPLHLHHGQFGIRLQENQEKTAVRRVLAPNTSTGSVQ